MSQDHEDATNLLRFLEEYVQLRTRVIRDLDSYRRDGDVIWFGDMPKTSGCGSPAWEEGYRDGIWLEVHKQQLPKPPAVPSRILPWVDEKLRDDQVPKLKEVIFVPDTEIELEQGEEPPLVEQHLSDHADIREVWEEYLVKWRPWFEEYRRKKSVQDLYIRLFQVYEKYRRNQEVYELVIGIGLFASDEPRTRRHVLVTNTEIHFDKNKGVLTVTRPEPPLGSGLRIEEEFLDSKPSIDKDIRTSLQELGDDLWNIGEVGSFLISLGNVIGPSINYVDALSIPSDLTGLAIYFAPAIILRRRTQRNIVQAYRDLIQLFSDGQPIPVGLRRLFHSEGEPPGNEAADGTVSDGTAKGTSSETPFYYFPLPRNEEQERIVSRLGSKHGILVQGPPGTGKSHTIANLISHLLAIGKRVLVTSEAPRALRVLKDKIPPQLQPLCISILGQSSDVGRELNSSINKITERHAFYDPRRQSQNIKQLEETLEDANRRRAESYKKLLEIRESETREVTIVGGAYKGTAATIAKKLNQEQQEYGWIGKVNPNATSPLLEVEAQELLHLLRATNSMNINEINQSTIPINEVISGDEFSGLVQTERAAEEKYKRFSSIRIDGAYSLLKALGENDRGRLRQPLTSYVQILDSLSKRQEAWIPKALADFVAGRTHTWEHLNQQTKKELEIHGIQERAEVADSLQVSLPKDKPLDLILDDATTILDHFKSGGVWKRFGVLAGPVRGRAYLAKILVNTKPAKDRQVLENLIIYLTIKAKLERLWNHWKIHVTPSRGSLSAQLNELLDNLAVLTQLEKLREKQTEIINQLSDTTAAISLESEQPQKYLMLLDAIDSELALEGARAPFERLEASLKRAASSPNAHSVNERLLLALTSRDIQEWEAAFEELTKIQDRRNQYHRLQDLLKRFEDAVPDVTLALRDSFQEDIWDNRFASFQKAWQWVQGKAWIRVRNEPGLQRRIEKQYQKATDDIHEATAQLAAEKGWEQFMRRLTEEQRKHLKGWSNAVRRIPRSLQAKTRARFVRAAQEHMKYCLPAIPAWIMPHYRVPENLPMASEPFDVVIVDEASQTGIDGLFLLCLGKQIIIVGDDQQISPSDIGIRQEQVDALTRRYLQGQPFQEMYTGKQSLYDLAGVHFGDRIILREHFRCMPEIIGFSNQLCYRPIGSPLIPLRDYPPERLKPIETVYVEEGYQQGSASKAQNRPEAERIVETIAACLKDPRYENKSLGVISLLGEAQANLIFKLLVEKIGPEEMEARRLTCGDAYAFQGDERDIIFLSLVSAPEEGHTIRALTTSAARQRFNVAASRAKDQMWLFHSALPEHLSPNSQCVRRQILEYCLYGDQQRITESGIDIEALRKEARYPHRHQSPRPQPFDSWFEVDVFLRIHDKGYNVRPQVPVAEYRIDLVVEGRQKRLAIECDGDHWHGPENYKRDMARQRQLERAGWDFFRILESDFYLDPETALEPLWEELEKRKIYPRGTLAGSFSEAASGKTPRGDESLGVKAGNENKEIDPRNGIEDEGLAIPDSELEEKLLLTIKDLGSPTVRAAFENLAHQLGKEKVADTESLSRTFRRALFALVDKKKVKLGKKGSDQQGYLDREVRLYSDSDSLSPVTEAKDLAPDEIQNLIKRIPPECWLKLSSWARQKGLFNGRDRSFLYTMGKFRLQSRPATNREAKYLASLYMKARAAGFTCTE